MTWGHSSSFVVVEGDEVSRAKVRFATPHGREMNDLIRAYVEALSACFGGGEDLTRVAYRQPESWARCLGVDQGRLPAASVRGSVGTEHAPQAPAGVLEEFLAKFQLVAHEEQRTPCRRA